jgi:hypothetical protein
MAVDSRNIDYNKQRNTGIMLCSYLVLSSAKCRNNLNIRNSDVAKVIRYWVFTTIVKSNKLRQLVSYDVVLGYKTQT